MIVSRTPLRISLFGGGSDLPAFYQKQPGAVLSFTIDKYIHIVVQPVASQHVKVMYSEVEQVSHISQLKHNLVKTCLGVTGPSQNVEIASFADIPTKGTGLGSSSTFVVGLLKALDALRDIDSYGHMLAELAFGIENASRQVFYQLDNQVSMSHIGKQDHYAATFGGLNKFEFYANNEVNVQPVSMPYELSQNLFLVYTGKTRLADKILVRQTNLLLTDKTTFDKTLKLRDQVDLAMKYLRATCYDDIGALLDEAWRLKRSISPDQISSPEIDALYSKILSAGAIGGKLLGAGGGGYILAYVPHRNHEQFKSQFQPEELLPFAYTYQPSKVWTL